MRHGSVTGYRYHGCRCPECTEANMQAVRKTRARPEAIRARHALAARKARLRSAARKAAV